MTRLVYLVRREGLVSVFPSQVVTPMAAIAGSGVETEVAVFTPPGQWLRTRPRQRWRNLVDSVPAALIGRIRRLPSFPSRIDWPPAEARMLEWWLRSAYSAAGGPVVVQCRNATVTAMALQAKRRLPHMRVIFDCRGVLDYELLYKHGSTYDSAPAHVRKQAIALAELQRKASVEADAVFCVSNAMLEHLVDEYGISREKCLAIPCCVDIDRFAEAAGRREMMREALGLAERFVVAYCGSLAGYQLPDECIKLFGRVAEIDPRAHFLAVTTQPDAMRGLVRDAGLASDQVTVVSVSHREVPDHLAAADVGLLLRQRCPVNAVASPVKFGEYLASGTPVIMSEAIGDYSKLARREAVGCVLDPDWTNAEVDGCLRRFVGEYQTNPEEWHVRCQESARRHLDFARYIPEVTDIYGQICSDARVDGVGGALGAARTSEGSSRAAELGKITGVEYIRPECHEQH